MLQIERRCDDRREIESRFKSRSLRAGFVFRAMFNPRGHVSHFRKCPLTDLAATQTRNTIRTTFGITQLSHARRRASCEVFATTGQATCCETEKPWKSHK
jgi:hypothetical protein